MQKKVKKHPLLHILGTKQRTRPRLCFHGVNILMQQSAHFFFCKGLDGDYFRLCKSYSLWLQLLSLAVVHGSSYRQHVRNGQGWVWLISHTVPTPVLGSKQINVKGHQRQLQVPFREPPPQLPLVTFSVL